MTSKVHSAAPQNLFLNDSIASDTLSASSYRLHDYMNYGENHEFLPYSNSVSFPNMNLSSRFESVPPPPPYKMFYSNINNNMTVCTAKTSRANSPKEYESDDESSYSSMGTLESTGYNYNNNNNNTNNKSYNRLYQPSLYQPNVSCKNRYYQGGNNNNNNHNGARRGKYHKNADVMERRAHGLMERFKSRAYKMRIDVSPADLLNGGPWDQLNQAIWDVFHAKIQTEETYVSKLNLWNSIFLIIRKCFTSYGLFLVGSTMSGFGLEGSDIDICLLTKPAYTDPRVDSLHHLNHIKHLFLKSGLASEADLILAKVPILKFKNKESGFEVDLNCNNSVGIRNTHLLHNYAQLDWRVRPLVVMVKLWAQANKINDAKNMTISSYSLALMVIHYLQCGVAPPVLPCLHGLVPDRFNSNCDSHTTMDVQEELDILKDFESDNTSCLGDLLIGFFHYYAYFSYSQYAISVRAGSRLPIDECKFFHSPKNDPNQWKCLCIEEPFDFTNTARSVFDTDIFRHIKEIILCSYKELARNKTLDYVLPVNLNRQR